jgi:hypothetical protein
MNTDKETERAVQAGERNRATLELVRNWCRHACIRRASGIGMVEAQTGLPVGLLAMACEHAAAAGIIARDLADAAVDFYDRNCARCRHRVPVGFPNLSALVAERDAHRAQAEEQQQTARTQFLERRRRRTALRQALRSALPPLSGSLIECLEALDQDEPGDADERLVGAARLRPDSFAPELIEHLFTQLEDEDDWFAETGLRVLRELGTDPTRLAECAMANLSVERAVDVAAQIVELKAALVSPTRIAAALPVLARMANPERILGSRECAVETGALRALHAAHTAAVEAALEPLLSARDPRSVSLAAGAIEVLARTDGGILSRFRRSLAAKLRGAKYLIDERQTAFAGDDECLHRLERTLALALRREPTETDTLLVSLLAGADDASELRLYKVYTRVLTGGHRREHRAYQHHPATRVALKQLLSGLNSANEDVLREIQSALSYCAGEYTGLARAELSALLGSAVLLDDVLKRFDVAPSGQRSQRDAWVRLQATLLKWAAAAANDSTRHASQYLEVLAGIPEEREELRSALLVNARRFMETPEGFNAVLPNLYTSMVGKSVRLRSASAHLLEGLPESRRGDLPRLVHEAFTALLSDRYKMVHTAAVDALQHLKLPPELDRRAQQALQQLVGAYASAKDNDSFLLECIGLYWSRYAIDQEKVVLRTLYLQVLERLKPYAAVGELKALQRKLSALDGFVALTIRLLGPVTGKLQSTAKFHLIHCIHKQFT